MADVQIAVIDPEDTQLALAAPAEAVVNVAVPGIQGPVGTTGSVTIAQAGTAATPGIRFESDTNTGIYSPGADQLAVSTGGTGRLFVDASGNVGIGNSSPTQLLSLAGTSANILLAGTSNSYTTYNIGASNVGYVGDANWIFAGSSSDFGIRATSNLVFGIGATERLRIDSSGRVGIGTSSPGHKLDVAGGVNSTGLNATGTGGFFNSASKFGVDNNGGVTRMYSSGPDASTRGSFDFRTTDSVGTLDTSRMVIDSSGRVGIGTSSPGYALDVAAADTTAGIGYALRIRANATAGAGTLQFTDSGATTQYGVLIFGANGVGTLQAEGASSRLVFGTNSTERARIDSSGRLLVGASSKSATTSTTAKGVIGFGGGGALICAEASAVANNGTVDITVSTGGLHYFTGLLQVNNINAASGATNTQSLISVLGNTQGGTITTSVLHTATPGGGQSFTITYVATGILRFTNTSGSTCNVHINYTGGGINAS